jgi:NTP pyrophosphatase (non-canonical NTP hydrolase)
MRIQEFQRLIETIYLEKDAARGVDGTFRWFVEEVGELSRAVRDDDPASLQDEFADCLAWLSTLASLKGIDLGEAARRKYSAGCPRCGTSPCAC